MLTPSDIQVGDTITTKGQISHPPESSKATEYLVIHTHTTHTKKDHHYITVLGNNENSYPMVLTYFESVSGQEAYWTQPRDGVYIYRFSAC